MAKKEKTYTEAIEELQSILNRIESGDLDVDILAEEVKKAAVLLKYCKDKLYKIDAEIKKVLEDLD
ncbi:MAG: exodeoxyribonuclease small subunit [Bacteroidota bacterium]